MVTKTIQSEDTEYTRKKREPPDRDNQIPGSGQTKPLFVNYYSHSVPCCQWDFQRKLIYSVPSFYQGFRINKYKKLKERLKERLLPWSSALQALEEAQHEGKVGA